MISRLFPSFINAFASICMDEKRRPGQSKKLKATSGKESATAPDAKLPLVAKDSEWIGFRCRFDAPESTIASNLFPGVNFAQSTTMITKLLVGKRADFSRLHGKPAKLIKSNNAFPPLPESDVEQSSEIEVISVAKSAIAKKSNTDMDYDDDEDDEKEPERAMHVKRRKRRSEVKPIEEDSSFSMVISEKRKSAAKPSKANNSEGNLSKLAYRAASILLLNEADDADESQSDDASETRSTALVKRKQMNDK